MSQFYPAQMFYCSGWEAIHVSAYHCSRKDCSINISHYFFFQIDFEIAKTGISVHSCQVELYSKSRLSKWLYLIRIGVNWRTKQRSAEVFPGAAGTFKPKHIYKKEKHSVTYSGRLPNFQVSRDCIDLLDPVTLNFKSKCKSKLFYYTGLFYYTVVFNNSWCGLQYCSILGLASHLFSLTHYNLVLWLSHARRTGFRDWDAGVATILYSTDRETCRQLAAWLAPLPYPHLPQVIRKASIAQPERWYPYSHAGYGHGCVTKSMTLSVRDRCWSGLLTVNYTTHPPSPPRLDMQLLDVILPFQGHAFSHMIR